MPPGATRCPRCAPSTLRPKGRGRALSQVWAGSDAAVLAYMDVDLSTDLAAVLPLLAPLLSGHSDLAIGTRLGRGSRVVRGPKRELISRAYNLIVRTSLGAGFSDAQCGFKAIRAEAAAELLPLVEDPEWFFDTELLILAERSGMRIHEVPVDWVDDPSSTVDIVDTARKDLAGIWRLGPGPEQRPDPAGARCATRPGRGGQRLTAGHRRPARSLRPHRRRAAPWRTRRCTGCCDPGCRPNGPTRSRSCSPPSATRRPTGGSRSGSAAAPDRLRHQAQGLVVFGIGLAVTGGALMALDALAPDASRSVELVVLTAANILATLLRFLLYRAWVFGDRARGQPPASSPRGSRRPIHGGLPMTTSTQNPADAWWQPEPAPDDRGRPVGRHRPRPPRTPAGVPAVPAPATRPEVPDTRPTPTWARWALAALLAGTALLYLWGLSRNGWAELVLLRRRAGRAGELEGVVLRQLRCGQRHHRRQAARHRCG